MATIKRTGNDQIIAEDLTGAIPIEFAGTKMNGWLPFEGGCFVFVGQQINGVFTVDDVHLPVSKLKNQLPRLEANDVFNRSTFTECLQGEMIIILSDVWLDFEKVCFLKIAVYVIVFLLIYLFKSLKEEIVCFYKTFLVHIFVSFENVNFENYVRKKCEIFATNK